MRDHVAEDFSTVVFADVWVSVVVAEHFAGNVQMWRVLFVHVKALWTILVIPGMKYLILELTLLQGRMVADSPSSIISTAPPGIKTRLTSFKVD